MSVEIEFNNLFGNKLRTRVYAQKGAKVKEFNILLGLFGSWKSIHLIKLKVREKKRPNNCLMAHSTFITDTRKLPE